MLDRVGEGMTHGAIVVRGDVGCVRRCPHEGRAHPGGRECGRLRRHGHEAAGSCASRATPAISWRRRSRARIAAWRAAPSSSPATPATVVGDHMRRGMVLIEGSAGDYCASRMGAGTIAVWGRVGASPGLGMKRGTLLLQAAPEYMLPTFSDCGSSDAGLPRAAGAFLATRLREVRRHLRLAHPRATLHGRPRERRARRDPGVGLTMRHPRRADRGDVRRGVHGARGADPRHGAERAVGARMRLQADGVRHVGDRLQVRGGDRAGARARRDARRPPRRQRPPHGDGQGRARHAARRAHRADGADLSHHRVLRRLAGRPGSPAGRQAAALLRRRLPEQQGRRRPALLAHPGDGGRVPRAGATSAW